MIDRGGAFVVSRRPLDAAQRDAPNCDAISSGKGREAAAADDREMRRAVKAALKNGQLEEIMDEDMLSCWSRDAGDRKLALALLEAFQSPVVGERVDRFRCCTRDRRSKAARQEEAPLANE